jgi:hypothetical protein
MSTRERPASAGYLALLVAAATGVAAACNASAWITGSRPGTLGLVGSLVAAAAWIVAAAGLGRRSVGRFWWYLVGYWTLAAVVVPIAEAIAPGPLGLIVLLATTAPWYSLYDSSGPLAGVAATDAWRLVVLALVMVLCCAAAWTVARRLSSRSTGAPTPSP